MNRDRGSSALGRRQVLGRLGLAAGGVALSAGAAEGLARWLAPAGPPLRLGQFAEVVASKYRLQFEEVFVSDPELFWRLAPDVVLPDDAWPLPGRVSNGQGLREEYEVAADKPRGVLRCLCLGDSCTFGYGVARSDAWVARAEALLAAALPGQRVECLNAGVPGYSLYQGERRLELEGFGYRPDVVVLNFGWNDMIPWDGAGDIEHRQRIAAARPPSPLDASRLAQLAWSAMRRIDDEAAPGNRPRLLPHEFRERLERVHAATRERGVDLLLLVWGLERNLEHGAERDYRTPLQEEQYRFGETHRFPADEGPGHVDGVAVFQELGARLPASALFLDGIHASALGNEAVARAVVSRLLPWARARAAA